MATTAVKHAIKVILNKNNHVIVSAKNIEKTRWMRYDFRSVIMIGSTDIVMDTDDSVKHINISAIKDIITRIQTCDTSVTQVSYNGDYKNYIADNIYITVQPEKQAKSRKKSSSKYVIVEETADDYTAYTAPSIMTPDWVKRIFNGTADGEVIYSETDDYYLMPDFKWNRNIEDMHLLVLFKDLRLQSLRDLRGQHVGLLKETQTMVHKYIMDHYQIPKNQIITFFHYHPSAWQLHIHFQHVSAETSLSGCTQVGRAHLLNQVIYNLSLDSDYYKDATLTCVKLA
jgi:hypothetical protein